MTNLFDIPPDIPDQLIETLLRVENLRIERIVSHGHSSPPDFWYDQDQNECDLLVSGAAAAVRGRSDRDEARRLPQYRGAQATPSGMDNAGRTDDLAGRSLQRRVCLGRNRDGDSGER